MAEQADIIESLNEGELSEPIFRALSVDGVRRGIRLERLYWDQLNAIARQKNMKLNELIGTVAQTGEGGDNLTAALRLLVTRHLAGTARSQGSELGLRELVGLAAASPSPVLVLSADKKIMTYNQAFFAFLQSRLSTMTMEVLSKDFRLQIDTPIASLFEKLRTSPDQPVVASFMVGSNDQVFRGRMNTVAVRVNGQAALICYILA